MKRRAVCFLLCLCFCFYSLSLSSSAADDGIFEPIITRDDLFDMGYIEDENVDLVLYDEEHWWDSISLFSSSSKNFPNFDPATDIPWYSFPDYIKDIVYMDTSDLSKSDGSFVVPFVSAVVLSQSTVQIFVGVNVGWGTLNDASLSLGIWSLPYFPSIASSSCLYRLSWSYVNHSVVADWVEYSPQTFGNKGNLNRMLNYYFNDSSACDFYCYGANGVRYPYVYNDIDDTLSTVSSYSVFYNSSNNDLMCSFSINPRGFASREIVWHQNTLYSYAYFDSFTPPTAEELLQQEQNKTSKGIWETLKGIPEAIGEKIKGLFVPSEGFFDTYQQEFQTYFKDRFGILYEIPELVINLLQKFVTFNPKDSDYSITFPEVKLPVLEDGEWRDEKLIEAQEFSFDFINEAPFSLLYDAYVAFIWLVYIILLINLIKNKANGVFKGG